MNRYIKINSIKQFNFQINRVLTYGEAACDLDVIKRNLEHVTNIEEWYEAFINVATISEDYFHKAYAYRMAEFFLEYDDPRKQEVSKECLDYFQKGFQKNGIVFEQYMIPFETGTMKAFRFPCENPKDIMVVCGGYDSFIEEFVLQVYEFNKSGYEVILFEGPGQGECIKQQLVFRHDFDKATRVVLDFFSISSCVFIGISWGGYFAIRSAAFEKRIKKTIMYDAFYDGFEVMTNPLPVLLQHKIRKLIDENKVQDLETLCNRICEKSVMAKWMFHQGKYITGSGTYYEMYKKLGMHNVQSFHEKVTCDVLILGGEKDHYIPLKHYKKCIGLFPNAKSVKARLFTKKEGGEQHCQIGNHMLAINEIVKWLEPNAAIQ